MTMDVKAYLWSLTLVCIASAVVRVATGNSATKKYIDLLCSICVICAIIIPVIREIPSFDGEKIEDLIDGITDEYTVSDYDEIYKSYLLEQNLKEAESVLQTELCQRLSLDRDSVKITLRADATSEGVTVSEAVVSLGKGAYSADPERIAEYVRERVGAECRIIYD